MARCASVDEVQQIILDAKTQEMESSDYDSDSDVSYIISLDDDEESKDSKSKSPEDVQNGEQVITNGPVLSLQCLHEDSSEEEKELSRNSTESEIINEDYVPELSVNYEENDEHPHLMPVKIVSVNGSNTCVSPSSSSIPARNNWDGAHNFKIQIECNNKSRKADSPVYSELQNKLYVAKDHPFKVLVYAEDVPVGSVIKVSAVFSSVEHSYEILQRCATHAQQDFSKGVAAFQHFVQCFSNNSFYEKNSVTGRLSVSVPYEKPQEGEGCTTYLFKLTCFSSCIGGINRRPFTLIFTLEKDNIPLGRQTLEAKVCACPSRDFRTDEGREHKKKSNTDKISDKETSLTSKEEVTSKYTISVKDPELYLFLKQMKYLYEKNACYSKIKSDT